MWQKVHNRVYAKTLPALRGPRTKGDWIAMAAMIILASLGGLFAGFQADINIVHPPLQERGICPVSQGAQIDAQGCFIMQQIQVTVNGQTQEKAVRVPAGHVIIANVTK